MDLRLKPGKDRSVRNGHPWIFSGALDARRASAAAGEIVRVLDADGKFLAVGSFNPSCGIAVRVLSLDDRTIDAAWLRARVEAAVALRRALLPPNTDTYRLLNGEGDFLPGIVADVYGPIVVLQCLTAGASRLKPDLLDAIEAVLQPAGVFERSAGSVRREEGVAQEIGVARGSVPDEAFVVHENGLRFWVDVRSGQKTGFFLDQRPNRERVRALAAGRSVLNAFAYTGAFSVYAAAGGARSVHSVESSAPALELARRNWSENALAADAASFDDADVFQYLRQTHDTFELIVLDPPALAKHRHETERAARAYKDLHLWAFKHAAKGALVATFTCSQHMPLEIFVRSVSAGANDARRRIQILEHLGPGADHPVLAYHPEGEYLRGLLLRVS